MFQSLLQRVVFWFFLMWNRSPPSRGIHNDSQSPSWHGAACISHHHPKADLSPGFPHAISAPSILIRSDISRCFFICCFLNQAGPSQTGRSTPTLWISLMKKHTMAWFLPRVIQKCKRRSNEATETFLEEMVLLKYKKMRAIFWDFNLTISHLNVPFKLISTLLDHEDLRYTSTYSNSAPFYTTCLFSRRNTDAVVSIYHPCKDWSWVEMRSLKTSK